MRHLTKALNESQNLKQMDKEVYGQKEKKTTIKEIITSMKQKKQQIQS